MSKIIELQLNQAAELLLRPEKFKLRRRPLEAYEGNLRLGEFEAAMSKLETLASKNGAKSGFWRRLKKAAESMGHNDKVEEYERRFRAALTGNV